MRVSVRMSGDVPALPCGGSEVGSRKSGRIRVGGWYIGTLYRNRSVCRTFREIGRKAPTAVPVLRARAVQGRVPRRWLGLMCQRSAPGWADSGSQALAFRGQVGRDSQQLGRNRLKHRDVRQLERAASGTRLIFKRRKKRKMERLGTHRHLALWETGHNPAEWASCSVQPARSVGCRALGPRA